MVLKIYLVHIDVKITIISITLWEYVCLELIYFVMNLIVSCNYVRLVRYQ